MQKNRYLVLGVLTLIALVFTPANVWGFGSSRPKPKPKDTGIQAHPIREVDLAHITVPAFYLPNGNRVDMNTDLETIIDTEINRSRYFRTSHNGGQSRLVITGGVTSLELDVLQLNLRIGWNPAGSLPVVGDAGVFGQVDLRLSTLSMDFKIYDRATGVTYLASYTDETLSDLRFTVGVEISQITSSVELLTRTRLAEAIRSAVGDIMASMEEHPDMPYVPWETTVLGLEESRQDVTIGAGGRQGIKKNFVFSIYSTCENVSDQFCYERFLSDVRVNQVGNQSSRAVPYKNSDSLRNVYPGDKVYVKPLRND